MKLFLQVLMLLIIAGIFSYNNSIFAAYPTPPFAGTYTGGTISEYLRRILVTANDSSSGTVKQSQNVGMEGSTPILYGGVNGVSIGINTDSGYSLNVYSNGFGGPDRGKVNTSHGFCIADDCISAWADVALSAFGTGTTNYLPLWTASGTKLTNSIVSQNSGRIGIMNTSPTELLDINGRAKTSGGYCIGGYCISSWADVMTFFSGTPNYLVKWNSSGTGFTINSSIYDDGSSIGIHTNSPAYNLDLSGSLRVTRASYLGTTLGQNVGIGNTAPGYKLDVSGSFRSTSYTYLSTSNGQTVVGGVLAGSGIYKLDVFGGYINSYSGYCINGDCKNSWAAIAFPFTGSSNYFPKWNASGTALTQNSLVYDNGTSVGIGTASPLNGVLDVSGSIAMYGNRVFFYAPSSFSLGIGVNSLNTATPGFFNVGVGYRVLTSNNLGLGNVGVGHNSLQGNVNGSNNVSVGYSALSSNSDGLANVTVGAQSMINNTNGSYNTALGFQGLDTNTDGTGNTAIGYLSDVNGGNLTNATAIGAHSRVDSSNTLVLGSVSGINGATSDTKVVIGRNSASSGAYKLDVRGGYVNSSSGYCINDDCKDNWASIAASLAFSGAPNYHVKWNSAGNGFVTTGSLIYDNSTTVGINTATPTAGYSLDISGSTRVTGNIVAGAANLYDLGGPAIAQRFRNIYVGTGIIYNTGFIATTAGTRFLVGTGNTGSGAYKADIYGGYVNSSSGYCINGNCVASWTGTSMGPWTFNGATSVYPNQTAWNVAIGSTTIPGGYKFYVNGNARVNGNIVPNTTITTDLGLGALRWRTLYAREINLTSTGFIATTAGTRLLVGTGNTGSGAYKADIYGGYVNSSSGYCINGNCVASWAEVSSSFSGTPNRLAKVNTLGNQLIDSYVYETSTGMGFSGTLQSGNIPWGNIINIPNATISNSGIVLLTNNYTGSSQNIAVTQQATNALYNDLRNYTDSAIAGLSWKQAVKVATTGDIALNNSTTVIDGYTLQNGDRILVKDQATPSQNGIYIVNTSGVWSRSLDADSSPEFLGMAVYVHEGMLNATTGWVLTYDGSAINLGVSSLAYSQFSGNGAYIGIAPIHVTGNIISMLQSTAMQDGYLSSTDWNVFNNKLSGSGTVNYVPRFTNSNTIGNSNIVSSGTTVGINTATPTAGYSLDISGSTRVTGNIVAGAANLYDLGGPAIAQRFRNIYVGTGIIYNTGFIATTAGTRLLVGTGNTGSGAYKADIYGGYVNSSSGYCINGNCVASWTGTSMGPWTLSGNIISPNSTDWLLAIGGNSISSGAYRVNIFSGFLNSMSGLCINNTCLADWTDLNNLVKSRGTAHFLAKFDSGGYIGDSSLYETGAQLWIQDIDEIINDWGSSPVNRGAITIANYSAGPATSGTNPLLTLRDKSDNKTCGIWLGVGKIQSNCTWDGGAASTTTIQNNVVKYDDTVGTMTGSALFSVGNQIGINTATPTAGYSLDISGSTRVTGNIVAGAANLYDLGGPAIAQRFRNIYVGTGIIYNTGFIATTAGTRLLVGTGNTGSGAYKADIYGGYVNSSSGYCINGNCVASWTGTSMGPWTFNGATSVYPNQTAWNVALGASSVTAGYRLDINGNTRSAGNMNPSVSNTYDLGTSLLYWNNLYVRTATISTSLCLNGNCIASWTGASVGPWSISGATVFNNTGSSVAIGKSTVGSGVYKLDIAGGYANVSSGICINNSCLNSWSAILSVLQGSGNYLPKWNAAGTAIVPSRLRDDGTNISIATGSLQYVSITPANSSQYSQVLVSSGGVLKQGLTSREKLRIFAYSNYGPNNDNSTRQRLCIDASTDFTNCRAANGYNLTNVPNFNIVDPTSYTGGIGEYIPSNGTRPGYFISYFTGTYLVVNSYTFTSNSMTTNDLGCNVFPYYSLYNNVGSLPNLDRYDATMADAHFTINSTSVITNVVSSTNLSIPTQKNTRVGSQFVSNVFMTPGQVLLMTIGVQSCASRADRDMSLVINLQKKMTLSIAEL